MLRMAGLRSVGVVWVLMLTVGCGDDDGGEQAGPTSGGSGGSSGSGGSGAASAGGNGGDGASGDGGNGAGGGNGGSGATSAGAGGAGAEPSSGSGIGSVHEGEYHLGPVEWEGSFWNSCGPYPAEVSEVQGDLLVGVGLDFNGDGQLCDSCVRITADTGKSVVARVITTGETTHPNNVDLSSVAFDALHSDEFPRSMQWQIVPCADNGGLIYQFQTLANVDWTSFWVRNPKVPIDKVEVQSDRHPSFVELDRGSDGTFTAGSGVGPGPFTLRLTGRDGQVISETLPAFEAGEVIHSTLQFE